MVRDLVEKCTCPSQFPMIRVSEGKYRIGDTKVLIFVRILRSHVMVRVGGGWDTLSHYLDKHDPCRCRAQHRTSVAAKIFTRTNQQNGIELHKAQVVYERSPPPSRKLSTTGNASTGTTGNNTQTNGHLSSPTATASRHNRSRSRSPAIRKPKAASAAITIDSNQHLLASPNMQRRSMSPSPRRIGDIKKKQNSLESTHVSSVQIPISNEHSESNQLAIQATAAATNDGANKYENVSDNGSEISDEGYRSLGLIQSNNPKRISLHSQASNEDGDTSGRLDRQSPDMTTTTSEDNTTISISEIKPESPVSDGDVIDPVKEMETKFAKCGIVMNDDEISVDIASTTGLRKTGFSEVLYEDNPIIAARKVTQSRIPKSPMLTRRKSMDNCSTVGNDDSDSLRRAAATYRSIRKPQQQQQQKNTWNGRSSVSPTNQGNNKKRPALTADTFKSPTRTASLTRNTPTRSSQQFDGRPRQRSSTRASSVNTSPNKSMSNNNNTSQSQLAQQLLDAAGKAKNDTQILSKIKQILSDYASKNKINCDFEDFTATWVNNNGNLDATDATAGCSNNNGSPLKSSSKRSSSVSTSSDSNPTSSAREMSSLIVSPRRIDKGLSRIPAPIRSNTGLY
ncbi:hypothetical protein PVAND_009151 [Polypedilum vanderplanki]|uniref:GAR domain-containing protein n=1 Tax=Polypedilum vanderplanki TaxID=319348 RepID=A0A9J6CC84_POLVA|nr:hypothetical protein PVAND_009151 [Polypedilum vanderplanki]